MTSTVFKSESQPDWGMGLVVEDVAFLLRIAGEGW